MHLAVAAQVPHQETGYDELPERSTDRQEARDRVGEPVGRAWRGGAPGTASLPVWERKPRSGPRSELTIVHDHGTFARMAKETIPISAFKARCLAVLRRVKATGRPVVVTKFGEAIAEIVPPTVVPPAEPWLGKLKDRAKITGDIMAPVVDSADWDAIGT